VCTASVIISGVSVSEAGLAPRVSCVSVTTVVALLTATATTARASVDLAGTDDTAR